MKGFSKLPNAVLLDSTLDPTAKIVLAGLDYYDRGRGCFAKRTTMAKLLNVSIYQLRKALKVLEENGYIVIHKRHHGLTDIIRRVEADKPLSDENSNSNKHYKKHISTKDKLTSKTEVLREKETDTAPCLIPDKNEDPPIDLSATERCHKRLQELLTYAKWEKWFSDGWVVEEKPLELTFFIPKPYVADYIDQVFRHKIEKEFGKELIIVGVLAKPFG